MTKGRLCKRTSRSSLESPPKLLILGGLEGSENWNKSLQSVTPDNDDDNDDDAVTAVKVVVVVVAARQ